jgi:hypothetical protein
MAMYLKPSGRAGDLKTQVQATRMLHSTLLLAVWWDAFNLSQLGLVCVGLIESIIIHGFTARDMGDVAYHIDRVCRLVVPLLLYPGITIAFLLYGTLELTTTALTIGVLTTSVSFISIPIFAVRNIKHMAVVRARALHDVSPASGASPADPDWEQKVYRLFNAFDADDSGDIDIKEMRALVSQMHPTLPKNHVRTALLQMKQYCDNDGRLDLGNLLDAISTVDEFVRSFPDEVKRQWKE